MCELEFETIKVQKMTTFCYESKDGDIFEGAIIESESNDGTGDITVEMISGNDLDDLSQEELGLFWEKYEKHMKNNNK